MWNLKVIDTNKPLYLAVADALQRDIKAGLLKPGDKLPTHRRLAKLVGVNVSTITRAYSEAEKQGLIKAVIGSGTFVSSQLGFASTSSLENNTGLIEMGFVLNLNQAEASIDKFLKSALLKIGQASTLRYIPPPGSHYYRELGAKWINRFGLNTDASQIVITCGAQHALNCTLSALFKPGDRIAVDNLTYSGFKSVAKHYGLILEGLATDRDGIKPKSLVALCGHHEIKGLCTVTTMQNPTNSHIPLERQQELAQIIRQHDLKLIEDDTYRFLAEDAPPPLSCLVPDHSIYITGISKALYVGFRITFLSAPKNVAQAIAQAVVDSVLMVSPIDLALVGEALESGLIETLIDEKIAEMKKRFALFASKMVGYEYFYAPHSMFVWLKLPHHLTSGEFENICQQNGLNVSSSERFVVGGMVPPNFIRLSLTGPHDLEELDRGLDILLKVLQGEFEPQEVRQLTF